MTTYRVLSDTLYRSVAIVTTDNVVTEAYDCDAYGNTLCYSGPGTDGVWFTDDDTRTNNPINTTIFTGREFDPESLIYYYRARYYSPLIGRFISRDPLKDAEFSHGANLYWYVQDNVVNRIDPLGLTDGTTTNTGSPSTGSSPTINHTTEGCDWTLAIGHGHVPGTMNDSPNTNNSYYNQHGNSCTAYVGCGSNALNNGGLGSGLPLNNYTPKFPTPTDTAQNGDEVPEAQVVSYAANALQLLETQAKDACKTKECCKVGKVVINILCNVGTDAALSQMLNAWGKCGTTDTIKCTS